jgi:aspartate aminotransferase-like enzyme
MFKKRSLYVFPGTIEKEILDIGCQQIPYMRTEEFSHVYSQCSSLISKYSECEEGKTFIYTMSGTAALEAAILSFCRSKRNISINGGSFGARWKQICDYHSIYCDEINVEPGKGINMSLLEHKLIANNYEVLMMQHHETSTGELFDLKEVGRLCQKYNVLLIVDYISSFLSDKFSMDEFNVDVAIGSCQKALNIPPGLAFITLSKLAQSCYESSNFYFDFTNQMENLSRGQTPFSPATQLFLQLQCRLLEVENVGVDSYINRIANRARFFRTLCRENNWEMLANNPSNLITGVLVKSDAYAVSQCLIKDNYYVMPSGNKNLLRVAHGGIEEKSDVLELVRLIKKYERDLQ